jgi:hypothetical protein
LALELGLQRALPQNPRKAMTNHTVAHHELVDRLAKGLHVRVPADWRRVEALDPLKTAGRCFRANYPEMVNRCGLAAHFDCRKGLEVKERRDEPVGVSRNLNCARCGSLLHPSGQIPILKAIQAEYTAPASPKQTR